MIDAAEIQQAIDIMITRAGAHIEPGEEIFDMNGDCYVDTNDILRMGMVYSTPLGSKTLGPNPILP